jgi:histidinol-phosphate/aromatic aminotransferase/cobyric acid decarboxylase-like protein/choline kinase
MQAIIPAAGMGKRLGAETADKTKAMVDIHGRTLIERCLDALVENGIERIILVVGYQKDKLKNLIGSSYKGIEVIYVENNIFSTTNNIYSVYLARHHLIQDDTILIESDLVFDPKLISILIKNPTENLALVDKYQNWMDGTVVKLNDDFSISHFISKTEFSYSEVHEYYKTVNIYKFSKSFLSDVYVPFLEAYASALGHNEYYEQVLRVIVNLDKKHIKALPLSGEPWYEIDDAQDLDIATLLFSEPDQRYKLLTGRYGGYWRFEDLKDFCYLVNPYFPPESLNNEIKYNLPKLMQSYPSGEQVQAMLAGKMFNLPDSYIAVGNGAAELIEKVTVTLNDSLGLFRPTFEEYPVRFNNIDCRVPKAEGFAYGKDEIIKLAEKNNGVILINPDNPSGNFIPYRDLIFILDYLKPLGKCLLVDESFIDFAEGGFESSLLNVQDLDKYPNLVVIKSIGKSYGVGGLRLGVIASSNTDLLKQIKNSLPVWNINSVAEFYLQIIGKYMSEYEESCAKIITARAQLLVDLRSISYLKPYDSQANYILCKVVGKDAAKLASDLCNKFSILIKDCSGKAGIDDQYIRVAVRDTRDNEDLVSGLRALL